MPKVDALIAKTKEDTKGMKAAPKTGNATSSKGGRVVVVPNRKYVKVYCISNCPFNKAAPKVLETEAAQWIAEVGRCAKHPNQPLTLDKPALVQFTLEEPAKQATLGELVGATTS